MRTFTVPAMYGPLIVEALKHLVEVRADGHARFERLRAANPDAGEAELYRALAASVVPEGDLDRTQVGELVITIASMPADSDVLAFPVREPMQAAS